MKQYLFSYRFRESVYSMTIEAENPAEAQARLSVMAQATFDGELKGRVQVLPRGWWSFLDRRRSNG